MPAVDASANLKLYPAIYYVIYIYIRIYNVKIFKDFNQISLIMKTIISSIIAIDN